MPSFNRTQVSTCGCHCRDGYPDGEYLKSVRKMLKEKGVG